jgi:hypothetical protein
MQLIEKALPSRDGWGRLNVLQAAALATKSDMVFRCRCASIGNHHNVGST